MKKRVYKDFDEELFLKDLSSSKEKGDYSNVLASNNTDEAVEEFTKAFNKTLDKHAPIKIIQIHKNFLPYLSTEIKEQMQYRNKLRKQ